MRNVIILSLTALFAYTTFAQEIEDFEKRICTILEKARNYEGVERVLQLIEWESDIVYNIPCISPIVPLDFRKIPISSGYGKRYHPILNEYRHHAGIDIPGASRDTVYASARGRVVAVGFNEVLGNYVKVGHSFGFETIYGHLDGVLVRTNEALDIGEVLGLLGNTGRSTGPHLHYSVIKNGKDQDAYPYCYLLLTLLKEWNHPPN